MCANVFDTGDKLRRFCAAHVIPAHTESSLALGPGLLQDIGVTCDDVEALVTDMRRDHYALLAPGTTRA